MATRCLNGRPATSTATSQPQGFTLRKGLRSTFMPMNGDLNQFVIPMLFGDGWPKMRDKFADMMTSEILHLGDHYLETIPAMLDLMQGPNTLAHLDFRIDNVLFGGHGATLLDFQLAAVSNGVVDIAYFVSRSLQSDLAAHTNSSRKQNGLRMRTRDDS